MAGGDRHSWNGRPVLKPEHADELERDAAEYEFKDRLSRRHAEEKAYRKYRQHHHEKSAAFHLRGMRAAQGSNDSEAARKHSAMFEMHMKKLGHEPWREVPPEIQRHLKEDEVEPIHRFRAHHGDRFVLEHKARESAEPVAKALHRIWGKGVEVLAKTEGHPVFKVGDDVEHGGQRLKVLKIHLGPAGQKHLYVVQNPQTQASAHVWEDQLSMPGAGQT